MKTIVVLGATSAIVIATLRSLVSRGQYQFLLVGRDSEKLKIIKDDLVARGAIKCETFVAELSESTAPASVLQSATTYFAQIDSVYLGYATLPDQKRAEEDVEYAVESLKINFISPIAHLTLWANYLNNIARGRLLSSAQWPGIEEGKVIMFTAVQRVELFDICRACAIVSIRQVLMF